jgi:hypothetical protein
VTVYAPVPKPREASIDPHEPKDDDSLVVANWRQRMGTEEAKQIYKERAATAETVNADLRTLRGLDRLVVRGADKVKSVLLWGVLTYNLLRWGSPRLSAPSAGAPRPSTVPQPPSAPRPEARGPRPEAPENLKRNLHSL